MIEPTKEQLAEALRKYPSWGHAYVAEKARADGLEEQFEAAAAALRWISSNHPKVIREMPTDLYRAMMEPALSNPAKNPGAPLQKDCNLGTGRP